MRRLSALAGLLLALAAPATATADSTGVFRTPDAFQQLQDTWLFGENASVSVGGGGPAPVNQVAPYFCGQTGVAANVDMVGGCTSTTASAVQSQTLAVGTGVWSNSPTSFSYQWQACTTTGGQPPTTGSCADIAGATSSSYTVQAGDVGKALVPKVTASNGTASTPTTAAGSCNTGSTVGGDHTPETGTSTVFLDPTEPAGCSPISAVVGATSAGMKFCTNSPVTCGFPDPLSGNAGVPHGTTLTTQASTITCSSGTVTGVYGTGGATLSGTCTLTNSRIIGEINLNACSSCTVTHTDVAGEYVGKSSATTGTGEASNVAAQCSYVWNGTDSGSGQDLGKDVVLANTSGDASNQATSNNYLHCSAEPQNGSVGSTGSYIISDECWGPCYTGPQTHNEAIYAYGGQTGLNIVGNVIANPWHQTAGLFTDCGWNGSPISEHVNGNLAFTYDNNGALGVDDEAFGCVGTSTDNQVENNRFAYIYNSGMNCGHFNGDHMTITGNVRDDTTAAITTDQGC